MYAPLKSWAKRPCKNYAGYVIIGVAEHPKAFDGWYYEHRLVIERSLGRVLEDWETVHHINENKHDNRIENLFLCTRYQHDKAHKRKGS